MNIIALFTHFALPSIQELAELIEAHQDKVNLLSFVVTALTAFMMWMAYRRIKSEQWIKYLAWAFFLLSVLYLWYWLNASKVIESPDFLKLEFLFVAFVSISNNLFGIAAARDIQNRKSLFPSLSKLLPKFLQRKPNKAEPLIPKWCWWLAAGAIITSIIGYPPLAQNLPWSYESHKMAYELIGRSFESVFSAICLFWLGYAISANLSNRRHPLIASGAFLFAVFYAIVQLGFGLSPLLGEYFIEADTFGRKLLLFDKFLIGLSLPLKIFLCAFAYRLVIRFFETLSDLRKLQDSGFNRRQDYLSSDGVLNLIGERLQDYLSIRERLRSYLSSRESMKRISQKLLSVTRPERGDDTAESEKFIERGFVNLSIKLPGENNKRIVSIFWPNRAREKRAKPFDWQPERKSFSSITEDDAKNSEIVAELKEALPFVHIVLTDDKRQEIVWPEDELESEGGLETYKGNMKAVANMRIKAHGAAIGCLQIGRSTAPFSQMAIRQIREIANLLSPAVQAYRELAGLDQMSIRFAMKQAETSTYSPEEATKEVATILHDIFAPTVTRLHIDFGFSITNPLYESDRNREELIENITEEIGDKDWKQVGDTAEDKLGTYRLLKKQLTARVTETISYKPPPQGRDRFTMGNLLFAVRDGEDIYDHAALGTTYLHRKTASTLAADAYLDFTRDYYNELLKMLGQDLSRKRLNIDEWFEPVERILTTRAHLSWVVARQKGRKASLGNDQGLCILRKLRQHSQCRQKFPSGQIEIVHYRLKSPQLNSNHVLRLKPRNSDLCIWLGVERPNFGPELEFSSPWKTFLVNLTQLADASLSRLTFPEKFQVQLEAAQLQGIIASMLTTGTVIHQFKNMIAGQLGTLRTLLNGIALGEVKTDADHEQNLRAMDDTAKRMMEVFQSISRLTVTDERRPCQLLEAARHAFKLNEVSLVARGIKREIEIGPDVSVNVPYNVAVLALATLVGNSKDAVKDKGGRIRIEATKDGDFVMCRVIDDGKGINPAIRNKIFEPKNSTKEYGTGFGLYLTSHSLSEHGASIELTKSDETGSTFTINFPLP